MSQKKQRVFQHVMEDESYRIIKNNIPKEWVIREFNRPDYGVDIVIELFEKVNDKVAETLGEFIYVQVKSVSEVEIKTETIYEVENVAKGTWIEDKTKHAKIEVIKYLLDTNSIYTIQSLGSSVSFLLFVVDIKNQEAYFVCLNDYIDKIVLPQNRGYTKQKYLTITIPVLNKLSNKEIASSALKFYGKRAKLLASFSKFSYQKNEISYLLGFKDYPILTNRDELEEEKSLEEIKTQLLYFILQIEELDIWTHNEWQVLPLARKDIITLKSLLQQHDLNWQTIEKNTILLWHELTNLGRMYEEICREWFLPKVISLMTSYPTMPEIIDDKKANAQQ